MKPVRMLALLATLALGGCDDDPLKSRAPGEPTPPTQGLQAFVQVDNESAAVGEEVTIFVRMQVGSENGAKIGSYTGRLRFDAEALAWSSDREINDGLRVANPRAADGEVRFAGASAAGFADHTLYAGKFTVKKAGYAQGLALEMQEISAAATLGDLRPQLQVAPQVFFQSAAP